MKILFHKRNIPLFFSFFVLTFAGSTWAVNQGMDRLLEYITYAVLLTDISLNYITSKKIGNKQRKTGMFFFVTILLFYGLCVQQMPFGKLFPLLMTMVVISVSSLLSESYLDSYRRIKIASDAVLWGNIVALVLSVLFGYTVIQTHSEMNIFAFSGGIAVKNYFGADMLIIFIGNYLAERETPKLNHKLLMVISVLFLLLSNSRGAIIMFVVFLVGMRVSVVHKITKRQRKLFTITAILLCIGASIVLYQEIMRNSFNYMMRINGFLNYINHPTTDFIKILIGNAKELYVSDFDYVTQFRRLYGWNESVEFALLDILIKNGIIGLIGYIVIFYILIRTFIKSENWEYKSTGIAIAVMFLISALVENYIQSIHFPIGIYCYLVMGGIVGMCNREDAERRLN